MIVFILVFVIIIDSVINDHRLWLRWWRDWAPPRGTGPMWARMLWDKIARAAMSIVNGWPPMMIGVDWAWRCTAIMADSDVKIILLAVIATHFDKAWVGCLWTRLNNEFLFARISGLLLEGCQKPLSLSSRWEVPTRPIKNEQEGFLI